MGARSVLMYVEGLWHAASRSTCWPLSRETVSRGHLDVDQIMQRVHELVRTCQPKGSLVELNAICAAMNVA